MSSDLLLISLHFPVRTPPTRLQTSSCTEIDGNWKGVSTAHDGVNWTPCTGLLSKHNIQYFFLQLVSQDSAQELFCRSETLPYPGVSRSEFHVRCLRIRFDSQGVVVVVVLSVGLGSSYTVTLNTH